MIMQSRFRPLSIGLLLSATALPAVAQEFSKQVPLGLQWNREGGRVKQLSATFRNPATGETSTRTAELTSGAETPTWVKLANVPVSVSEGGLVLDSLQQHPNLELAGLNKGDEIVSVNGKSVNGLAEFTRAMGSAGQSVTLQFRNQRNQTPRSAVVRLSDSLPGPDEETIRRNLPDRDLDPEDERARPRALGRGESVVLDKEEGFQLLGDKFDLEELHLNHTAKYQHAVAKFYDDGESWSDKELNVAILTMITIDGWCGDNSLLLWDPNNFYTVHYIQVNDDRLEEILGKPPSGRSWGGFNSQQENSTVIAIKEWNASKEKENEWTRQVFVHEIFHNFDTPEELSHIFTYRYDGFAPGLIGASVYWKFVMQSGWYPTKNSTGVSDEARELFEDNFKTFHGDPEKVNLVTSGDKKWKHRGDVSNFYRDYSKYNPREDWATTSELYYQIAIGAEGNNWRTDHKDVLEKLKIMDAFVMFLSSGQKPVIFRESELKGVLD